MDTFNCYYLLCNEFTLMFYVVLIDFTTDKVCTYILHIKHQYCEIVTNGQF